MAGVDLFILLISGKEAGPNLLSFADLEKQAVFLPEEGHLRRVQKEQLYESCVIREFLYLPFKVFSPLTVCLLNHHFRKEGAVELFQRLLSVPRLEYLLIEPKHQQPVRIDLDRHDPHMPVFLRRISLLL